MNKGTIGNHPNFLQYAMKHDISTVTEAAVQDKLAATYFITFADPTRLQGLWEKLSNATLLGRDDYPLTLTAAYDLLSHFKG